MNYSFEDHRLAATIEHNENEPLTFRLVDKQTGCQWGPVPLVHLRIHTRGLQRTETFTNYQVDRLEASDDGVQVMISRADLRLSLGLHLRVIDGELSVLLSPAEIYERMPSYFLLFAVDPLPGLMKTAADGVLLLPLGEGVACSPAGKPAVDDRFLLYLEQDRWELAPLLPVCACHSPQGGLIALARRCAADTECRVVTDGRDGGWCGFNFSLRRHWPDPVDPQVRELRLVPVVGDQEPVMTTAARLRQHVVDDLGKATLKERCAEDAGLAYLVDAFTMKLFHGIENEGPLCEGWDKSGPVSFHTCMTFAEAAQSLEKLKAAGIDRIHTQSVGWNARGHDGLYPTRFPVEQRLGGEEGFRRLLRSGAALGYQMNVHDNFVMNVAHAPDWNPDYVIHDKFGGPLVSGWWAGGVEYQTWGLALPQERFDSHFARLKELGVKGPYYVDYMLRPLEVNYHPKFKGPRSDSEKGQVRIFNETRKAFGAVATEFGTFPAAVACDYCTAVGHRARGRTFALCALLDQDVPLWDLTFHGLTIREIGGAANWKKVLQTILFGRHPRDEWSTRQGLMPVLTDNRIARLKAVYDLCLVRFGHLQTATITGWRRPDKGVEEVTFDSGETVTVDWQREELLVDGKNIACPAALAEK